MSYEQQKDQLNLGLVQVLTGVSLGLAGTIWFPPFHPIVINEFSATIIVAPTVTAAVVQLKKRITPGSETGMSIIATLTLPIAQAVGTVVYRKGLDVTMRPGDELVVAVLTAATAGSAVFGVAYHTSWEMPANNAEMVLSA